MGIVCIGQSAYDITVPIQEPVVDNRKYRIHTEMQCGGGPALNSACLCALWGAPVQLVSRIGKDPYGMKLRDILGKYGVQTDYLIPDEEIITPYSYIFVNTETGNRTIFNRPAVFSDITYAEEGLNPDVILSDGHEDKISVELIRKYPKAVSVIDAGTCRETTMNVAKYVDYLVCSEDFARQYTGEAINLEDWESCKKIFRKVKEINRKTAVITLGDKGLLYEEEGNLKRLPAYKVKAVDTTGAGDIFHGAFAYGLYQKLPLPENLKQSSAASAVSVQTLGGQISIPELKTVQQQMSP
ncbi:MAG: PfkB family carbohydrate kinase [Eubacteriales bacterium]|nr:PfkB family carbohydrate kinase [Eubacteriales bacterium]